MKTEQTPRPYSSAKDLMERTEKELSKGESAHTPGPWEVDSKGLVKRGFVEIALAFTTYPDGAKLPYGQANARLIAAAPELLAACKRVLDVITGDQAAELGIYTAIRSAEGRSNE